MINQFKEAMAAKPNCIEIMGHPGSTAFHDLVKQAVDRRHRRHLRQFAADRSAERVRPEGLRLRRRRSLRGRRADRQGDAGAGPEVRRPGDGLWRVQPGRARPVREGPRRHAREGRPQGRPARDHPGGQQRHVARRAGARRLHPGASEPEGHRHPARRRDRRSWRKC